MSAVLRFALSLRQKLTTQQLSTMLKKNRFAIIPAGETSLDQCPLSISILTSHLQNNVERETFRYGDERKRGFETLRHVEVVKERERRSRFSRRQKSSDGYSSLDHSEALIVHS